MLPLQFTEYYNFTSVFSPNLSKTEALANFLQDGGIPEYLKQKKISQKQADWSQSVANINRQLYAKYGLNEEDIGFIESMIKVMG